MIHDELKDVSRIGAPLSSMTVRCPACGGDGFREDGLHFGGNVGRSYRCQQCSGSGQVWIDVPAKPSV